jgi:hypothetical protein
MLFVSFWNRLIKRSWDLQTTIEERGRRWIRKTGLGFIVLLFGFSLIAEGFIGVLYYQLLDRGIKYLIVGDPSMNDGGPPLYVNPIMVLVFGLMVVLILLLEKRSEMKLKKR